MDELIFHNVLQKVISNKIITVKFDILNIMNDQQFSSFTEALTNNTSIITLDLSHQQIQDAGAGELANALKFNTTLTALGLSCNKIGVAGTGYIADALKDNNRTLTSLEFDSNRIGDAGAEKLANALKFNTTLTALDLSHNRIGVAGTGYIADALKDNNRTLTSLNLSHNRIGDAGAEKLANALKVNNETLTALDLSHNRIGDAGAGELAQALGGSKTLTSLSLEINIIGIAGIKALENAVSLGKTPIIHLPVSNLYADVGYLEAIREVIDRNYQVVSAVARDLIKIYNYEHDDDTNKDKKEYIFKVLEKPNRSAQHVEGALSRVEQYRLHAEEALNLKIKAGIFKRFSVADKQLLTDDIKTISGRDDNYAKDVIKYAKEYIADNYVKLICGATKYDRCTLLDLPETILTKISRFASSTHPLQNDTEDWPFGYLEQNDTEDWPFGYLEQTVQTQGQESAPHLSVSSEPVVNVLEPTAPELVVDYAGVTQDLECSYLT